MKKYLSSYPQLVKEFDFEKNVKLKPEDLSHGCHVRIWWKCVKGHSWDATVANRTYHKSRCPDCSKKRLSKSHNLRIYLKQNNPELLKFWNKKKNKKKCEDVFPSTTDKYWWYCQHCNTESFLSSPKDVFRKQIEKRNKYCKKCSSTNGRSLRVEKFVQKMVQINGNILDQMPEITKEWDYDKNKKGPESYTSNSHQKVWFKCLYGHPSYPATIYNKFNKKTKCPKCTIHSSEIEIRLFLELKKVFKNVLWQEKMSGTEIDILIKDLKLAIEVDGFPWHEKRFKQDLKKTNKLERLGLDVVRIRDKLISKNFGKFISVDTSNFTVIEFRKICIYLNKIKKNKIFKSLSLIKQFSCEKEFRKIYSELPKPTFEKSLKFKFPKISEEFDLKKNYPFRPEYFTPHSNRKVFWICDRGHSYETRIGGRTRRSRENIDKRNGKKIIKKGSNCPYCSGRLPCKENNATTHCPTIKKYWDYKLNKDKPHLFSKSSQSKVYFKCSNGHSFKKSVKSFVEAKTKCFRCNN